MGTGSPGNKQVGLALGGGVMRGWAHLGVLSVLEESGVPINFMSGTSAGSLIAAFYCAGNNVEQLIEYAREFGWLKIIRFTWPVRGFITFDKLTSWMVQRLGDLQFSDLEIPLTIVATDLMSGTPITIDSGRLSPAVQASCSVPGLVTPVELDGRLLCDGGISDMLPVSVLRNMGADYVIGVDIFPFTLRRYLGPLGYLLASLEILLERAGGGIDEADCLISPQLSGQTYVRLSKRQTLYDLGRKATLEKLDCIKLALGLM